MITAVEISDNSKTGHVSATYATQATCPTSCKLRGEICYAENGFTGFTTRRLNRQAAANPMHVNAIAKLEANAIETLSGKRPLRVHVVGDCSTNKAAKLISNAAAKHTAKHGQKAWSYTHAWREVKRESWGTMSIFASCESVKEIKRARRRGFATAVVVQAFKQDSAYVDNGEKLIPCPVQTGKSASCSTCQLCMKSDVLFAAKASIAFRPEGNTGEKAKTVLTQITLKA